MDGAHELSLYDELLGLIRDLYRGQEGQEIVEAFESSLNAHKTIDERLNILSHWVDFYRLRKYRKDRQRRRPTFRERVTACAACGYPVSHRHHAFDLATHGEHSFTVQLCANCHELQHLLYNALVNDSDYSRRLVNHVMYSEDIASAVLEKLLAYARGTIGYEARRGWVSADKASDEWLELALHWSEYQKSVAAK
jgi:5-methylcytosine-specific restriction endonuclease McrA